MNSGALQALGCVFLQICGLRAGCSCWCLCAALQHFLGSSLLFPKCINSELEPHVPHFHSPWFEPWLSAACSFCPLQVPNPVRSLLVPTCSTSTRHGSKPTCRFEHFKHRILVAHFRLLRAARRHVMVGTLRLVFEHFKPRTLAAHCMFPRVALRHLRVRTSVAHCMLICAALQHFRERTLRAAFQNLQ
jgi:hypothetical protein